MWTTKELLTDCLTPKLAKRAQLAKVEENGFPSVVQALMVVRATVERFIWGLVKPAMGVELSMSLIVKERTSYLSLVCVI